MNDETIVESAPAPVWLTTTEACKRARVSRRIIYEAVHQGRLRAAQIVGRGDLRFRLEWIDEWIESLAPVEIPRGRMARVGRR